MRQFLPIAGRVACADFLRCSRQARPKRSRNAFTLLELLIAMMLVVVLAVTLATSLAIGFRARTQGEQDMENTRSTELVMEALRADIQCALPPPTGSGNQMAGSFVGTDQQIDGIEADDLVFYTTSASPYHPEGGNGEIKRIELTCYQPLNSTDHVLVRRTRNNSLLQSTSDVTYDEEVLCRDVRGFGVQYYDGTTWLDSWDSTQSNPVNMLPVAVKIQLTLGSSRLDANKNPIPSTRIYQLPCSGLISASSSTVTTGGSSGAKAAPKASGGAR